MIRMKTFRKLLDISDAEVERMTLGKVYKWTGRMPGTKGLKKIIKRVV